MDSLLSWAQGLVFSAIAAGVVYLLSANNATDKAVKTVVSVFMLCALINPILSFKSAEDADIFSSDSEVVYEDGLYDEIYDETEKIAVKCIEEVLENEGVEAVSVKVRMNRNEGGEIYIEGAEVIVKEGEFDTDSLKTAVYDSTGLSVEIKTVR